MKKNIIVPIIYLILIFSVGCEISCNSKSKKNYLNEKMKMQQSASFNKEDSLKILILKGDTIAYL